LTAEVIDEYFSVFETSKRFELVFDILKKMIISNNEILQYMRDTPFLNKKNHTTYADKLISCPDDTTKMVCCSG
jgi:hypothetical protein